MTNMNLSIFRPYSYMDDQGNIIGSAEGKKESLALLKKYAEYNG